MHNSCTIGAAVLIFTISSCVFGSTRANFLDDLLSNNDSNDESSSKGAVEGDGENEPLPESDGIVCVQIIYSFIS